MAEIPPKKAKLCELYSQHNHLNHIYVIDFTTFLTILSRNFFTACECSSQSLGVRNTSMLRTTNQGFLGMDLAGKEGVSGGHRLVRWVGNQGTGVPSCHSPAWAKFSNFDHQGTDEAIKFEKYGEDSLLARGRMGEVPKSWRQRG